MDTPTAWHAHGLLFENCNCTLVCPGHMHFDQLCTHEKCLGYWAIRFDGGRFGDVDLGGLRALVTFECPQHMISGNWIERFIIDEATTPEQRGALETILSGQAGGPWAVLARFVVRRLDTLYRPIEFIEEGGSKRGRVEGLFEASVTPIRGRDRSKPVMFENIFNQIHASSQVVATGSTTYDDGVIRFETTGSHGLYSQFDWRVSP